MTARGEELEAAGRVLRLLGGGARSLRKEAAGDGWAIFPHGDRRRRPLMRVAPAVTHLLRSRGDIVATGLHADEWVVSGPRDLSPRPHIRPPVGVPNIDGARRAGGRGFAHLAQLAARGEGPLDHRMLRAAQDFIVLWEQANSAQRITQSWDLAAPADGGRRSGGAPISHAAQRARRRIERLRAKAGPATLAAIELALIYGLSLARLEKRLGWSKGGAGAALALALTTLADALDAGA